VASSDGCIMIAVQILFKWVEHFFLLLTNACGVYNHLVWGLF
jgi:hypothetical protein